MAKSLFTDEMKSKILEVAALDGSVEEMAYYCDVSRQTIYNWLEQDKAFFDKVERLRSRPVLAARQTAVKGVKENYHNAMDYLKRKKKLEFGDNIDVTSQGDSIKTINVIKNSDNKPLAEADDGMESVREPQD